MQISKVNGFSLIEIMVVVAIVSILAAVAFPSYQDSVRKSKRTEAKEALTSAAALQEKFFFQHNEYSTDLDDVGGDVTDKGYYEISVSRHSDCSGDTDVTCYEMSAVARASQSQFDDTRCRTFTIDYLGRKRASDSGDADTTDLCW